MVVGVCGIALALSAAAVGVASAAEYPLTGLPELGRCEKVTPAKTGKFNTKNCVGTNKREGGGHGNYEWHPGPGANGTFRIHMISPKFETVGGSQIGCSGATLTGAYQNGKEVKVTNDVLQGCENLTTHKECYSSPTAPGTIEDTEALTGEIGFITNPRNSTSPWVGLSLESETENGTFLKFICSSFVEVAGVGSEPDPSTIEDITFEGSVIGRIQKLNKMTAQNLLYYKQAGGHQNPESFIGFPKDTLTENATPASNPAAKKTEQVGLETTAELINGEEIEFKSKQH
jgi:hypothetical protein